MIGWVSSEAKLVNGLDITSLTICRKGGVEYCITNTVQLQIQRRIMVLTGDEMNA